MHEEADALVTGSSRPGPDTTATVFSRLTPERTMVTTVFILVFALGARLVIDTDVWWHLEAGDYTLDHWVIRHDPFSFTKAGESWIDHSWGSEVIMHLLYRALGYGGLELLTGTLALTGGWLVFRMSSGDTYQRALAVAFASLTASIFWTPRPQMFSYTLTAAVLYVLFLRRRRGIDALWLLPALMLVWANLHGAFVIGLVLIVATIIGESLENLMPFDRRGHLGWSAVRRLGFAGAVSLIAVSVNPYGPKLLGVPFATAGGSFTDQLEEWQPPTLDRAGFWPFAIMLALLIVSLAVSRGRVGWTDLILCAVATGLALSAGRNVSTFAVIVTPVLTYHLARGLEKRGWVVRPMRRATRPIAALNAALILIVAGIAATFVLEPFDNSKLEAAKRRTLPVDAVSYLREHPPKGRLFNDYAFGGYLIHALPEVPVFVDGRSDLYGGAFLDEYLAISRGGPRSARRLKRYDIGAVLVPRHSGLSTVLRGSAEWKLAYEDELATVFERRKR